VLAAFRTDSPVNIDLSVPIWTIEHVAAAFHLSVDAAREYTYREDFPRHSPTTSPTSTPESARGAVPSCAGTTSPTSHAALPAPPSRSGPRQPTLPRRRQGRR
jgi:hypothetical protein